MGYANGVSNVNCPVSHSQHILGKAIEKGHHDNSFTEDIIATLFCNITDILELHRDLVKELDSCIYPKGPAYESQVARCFLKHVSA